MGLKALKVCRRMKASSTWVLLIVVTVAMSRAKVATGNPASSGQEIISNEIPELHGGARPEKGPKKVGEGPGTGTGAGRSSLFPFPFHAFVQAAQFLQNSDISHPQHREPHIVDYNHRRQTVSPVPPRRHHINTLPSQPAAASIVQPQTTASPVVSVPTAPLSPEEDLNRIAGTVIHSVLEHKAQIITSLVNLINWLLGGFLSEGIRTHLQETQKMERLDPHIVTDRSATRTSKWLEGLCKTRLRFTGPGNTQTNTQHRLSLTEIRAHTVDDYHINLLNEL